MTITGLLIKSDRNNKRWIQISQFALFVSALVSLSVLYFFYRTVDVQRPILLLAASVFALLSFKKFPELSFIQRIVLLYIIEMLFNQLSGQFVHIQSVSISLTLIALVPLSISFICQKLQAAKTLSTEISDVFKSWAVSFAVIVLHMLFLFLLLKNFYDYGYEKNLNVLANMCLYFLVFLFSWYQLANVHLRRTTAIISAAFFVGMIIV